MVPLLMLVPDTVDDARPGAAVMCFPGSASSKELLAGEPELRPEQPPNKHPVANRMAWYYARAGLVAVALDNPGIGELDLLPAGVPPNSGRVKLTAQLIRLGRSYVELTVSQKLHVLAWLRSLPFVDAQRVAVSGHSLGTEPAMCMAVLDPSLAALVFNDFLCHVRQRHVVLGAATGPAMARRGSALARGPRHVQVVRLSGSAELVGRPAADHDRGRRQAALGPGPQSVPGTRIK